MFRYDLILQIFIVGSDSEIEQRKKWLKRLKEKNMHELQIILVFLSIKIQIQKH